MIVSYHDKRTEHFAAGKRVKAFSGIERPARLKLDRLEAASMLGDLAALPGNRFEALAGDRKGQYSIRVNDQWRICFEWPDKSPGPQNVEIVDYHQEETNGNHSDSSGRTHCGRTSSAGYECGRISAAIERADKSYYRHNQRSAWDHWRHSTATCSFFWHDSGVLAEPADLVRPSHR